NKPTMNWNSLRNRMIDLRNQDNKTCYINAALECLGSTLPLTEWLFEQVDNLNTYHFNCCLSSHLSISSTLPMKPTIIDQIFNMKLLSSGKRQAFDDTRCRHVSSNEVLNHPEAFMLFYAKVCSTSISMNESFQQ
ncbi:unnamed protein product, partial [Rotaria magnacalcarata]